MKMTGNHNVKLHEDSLTIVVTSSRNYFCVQVKDFCREIITRFYDIDGFEWQELAWYDKDGKRRIGPGFSTVDSLASRENSVNAFVAVCIIALWTVIYPEILLKNP